MGGFARSHGLPICAASGFALLVVVACGDEGDSKASGGTAGGGLGGGLTDANVEASVGGAAGANDASVDVATYCVPGEVASCYTGPPETLDVGTCKSGQKTCLVDGTSFTDCSDQVAPVAESCTPSGLDEDCDGQVDEECICVVGTSEPCYEGPAVTLNVGACHAGTRACVDGKSWGACTAQVLPTFDDCFTPADEDCDAAPVACAGDAIWGAQLESLGSGHAAAHGVASDGQGNLYVVGPFDGSLQPSGAANSVSSVSNSYDTYVAKYDSAGAHVWTKVLGGVGSATEDESRVAVDHAGNVIVAGQYRGSIVLNGTTYNPEAYKDIFVTKLDPAGNFLFARVFPGNVDETVTGIAVDPNNAIIVTGLFAITPVGQPAIGGHIDFGNGTGVLGNVARSGFVAKLSASGVPQWTRQIGDVQNFVARSASSPVVDAQFNVTVVASHGGTIESLGQQFSAGTYLYRFSSTGTLGFVSGFGFVGVGVVGGAVALTSSGGYVWVAAFADPVDLGFGTFTPDGTDLAVVSWSAAGVPLAAKQLTGTGNARVSGLVLDPAGNAVVAGFFSGTLGADGMSVTNGSTDGFVAKLSPSMSLGWINSVDVGGSNGLPLRDVAVDPAGNSIVAGEFLQSIQAGSVSFTSLDNIDGFLLKFGP